MQRHVRAMQSTYSISFQPFSCTFESGPLSGTQGMRGTQDRDLFSTCVSELVMESREFEMLLGKIQPDGSRKPGCIEKFQKDTSEVISFVAAEAERKGLYEDAVRLYDLAKVRRVVGVGYTHNRPSLNVAVATDPYLPQNHTKTLELLCRLLSHIASAPAAPQSDRARLQTLALGIAER